MADAALREFTRLSRRLGVRRTYTDGLGMRRSAPVESALAVMRALGAEIHRPEDATRENRRLDEEERSALCAPTVVSWGDKACRVPLSAGAWRATSLELSLRTDRGETAEWRANGGRWLDVPAPVPIGRHTLHIRDGEREEHATLFRAPRRCAQPASLERSLGVFLPLYAAERDDGVGLGDLGDLAALAAWAAERGCALLGTLPLLACFLDDPFDPSPYAPVSRSVFGEHFIDLRDAAARIGDGRLARLLRSSEFTRDAASAREGDSVDYRASWRLLRAALDAAAEDIASRDALRADVERFERDNPLLAAYADFRASRARDDAPRERRLFLCAQWLLHHQLRRAADPASAALYLDLPVGAHRDGFDAHRAPDLFPRGVSMGAPPDALFTRGQNWGFPPTSPSEALRTGHAMFAEALDAHLRYAKALRIDHAGGLHRAFWIPEGADATDGVYVDMPSESLYAALAAASHTHGALIIGEDLGAVPQSSRRAMDRHGVARMHIVQFDLGSDDAPLPAAPAGSLAALNTHDMPTIAAHLDGDDIDLLARLGIFAEAHAPALHEEREARRKRAVAALLERGRLDPAQANDDSAVVESLLAWLSEGPASVVLVSLEDLWLERSPQNVPGVVEGFPAWRRRAAYNVDEIVALPRLRNALDRLVAARATTAPGAARSSPKEGA